MLFTSQNFDRASGKVGSLIADSHRPHAIPPAPLPVNFNSFRLARPPPGPSSKLRLQPPSLLRDARAAWLALTPAGRLYWDYNPTFGSLYDRFGVEQAISTFDAFSKFHMLLSSHGALDHFDLNDCFIVKSWNFIRFRTIQADFDFGGIFHFIFTTFIADNASPLDDDSLCFFSYAAVPNTLHVRYRGVYPFKVHIPIDGLFGRSNFFSYTPSPQPDPDEPLRYFFRFSCLTPVIIQTEPFLARYLYFSTPVIYYVDYIAP